jgi:hypothetical protein
MLTPGPRTVSHVSEFQSTGRAAVEVYQERSSVGQADHYGGAAGLGVGELSGDVAGA